MSNNTTYNPIIAHVWLTTENGKVIAKAYNAEKCFICQFVTEVGSGAFPESWLATIQKAADMHDITKV